MARTLKESFLGRKYMSILRASVLVEAVAYIVSLTDTLVAGNMLGTAALSAVGLVAPAEVNESAAANLSETAVLLLEENGISSRTRMIIGVLIEDLLMLVYDKNRSGQKRLAAELTVMLEETGVRVILRDSGVIFDITDEDARIGSFREYCIARAMIIPEHKINIATSGYNRNEFFFHDCGPEEQSAAFSDVEP